MKRFIDQLEKTGILTKDELIQLIENRTPELSEYLFEKARKIREFHYGKDVYIRGLIEFTNYCKNNCYYCGIRSGNRKAQRYRLTHAEILECCEEGYQLGFRTFVLQGGEDPYYNDDMMEDIILDIKEHFPDCALTLSMGERSYESYLRFYRAGADRYLLRHETANEEHYGKLHPENLSPKYRKECLYHLKKIGYQVGTGFMVGSPWQTAENLAEDLLFIKELNPQMVGIYPYISHKDTPFKDQKSGSLELTLFMLGLLRLMLPSVLLPATTALGTIDPKGREKGILAGANVVMPNLSPVAVRKKYLLYDNKISTGDEAAECKNGLEQSMKSIGYEVVVARGDYIDADNQ